MKRSFLLCLVLSLLTSSLFAQKNAKKQKTTAYAITGVQKGQNNWTEVRLVDFATGDVVQTIYESKQEVEALNARTGLPVVKKDVLTSQNTTRVMHLNTSEKEKEPAAKSKLEKAKLDKDVAEKAKPRKVVDLDDELDRRVVTVVRATRAEPVVDAKYVTAYSHNSRVRADAPFATNSAACAFDKKHNRLYYTPMGISQLRYIDLKSNKIYYFEDEKFGALNGPRDVPNQITRMVIASDGNGYALTNNGDHLIRFNTNKKAVITDLGSLSDDASNGTNSVKSQHGYGGDMIASSNGDLYLLTANRKVFRIDIDSRVATYKGNIKGLPKEYSTNGAVVDEGTKVIVSSANSTLGYYSFDMNTLQAEKVSSSANVYNASDLANSTLLGEKKKKKDEPVEEPKKEVVATSTVSTVRVAPEELSLQTKISMYPNPATNGFVKLSFEDHPAGRYQIQFMDMAGKLISSQPITINNKVQVEEFRLPALIAKGSYLVQILNEENRAVSINKLAVQ